MHHLTLFFLEVCDGLVTKYVLTIGKNRNHEIDHQQNGVSKILN